MSFSPCFGPSGCGKTTVLRLIAGLESVDSGRIHLEDHDITHIPAENRHVNTVFQSYALFPHMTVFENVAFGLRMQKPRPRKLPPSTTPCVWCSETFAQRKPHQLSGGQQQRVAIARAVVNKPRLLLLDESLSALDYKLRKQMQNELKALQRKLGITFVFVTHDQEEALTMSDRIVVMREGKLSRTARRGNLRRAEKPVCRQLYRRNQHLQCHGYRTDRRAAGARQRRRPRMQYLRQLRR